MENTQICEQIIKDFNGKKIQGKIFSFESYKYVDLFKKPTRNGNLGKLIASWKSGCSFTLCYLSMSFHSSKEIETVWNTNMALHKH